MINPTFLYDGFFKVFRRQTSAGASREVVQTTDSVAALVYNVTRDEVLFVRQERPAMVRPDNSLGLTTEVVAGRIDKREGTKEILIGELLEELGIRGVEEKDIALLNFEVPLAPSPGALTEKITLAWVVVTQDQIDPEIRMFGTGAGEEIERVFIGAKELEQWAYHDLKSWGLVQWFLLQRERKRL